MTSLAADCSAVLALSRTLRAGSAGAAKRHPGQRLRAALCRSAGRDEGMVVAVEQRDGSCCGGAFGGVAGVEDDLALQQRAGDREQAIADCPQRTAVAMTAPAQLGVSPMAGRVMRAARLRNL